MTPGADNPATHTPPASLATPAETVTVAAPTPTLAPNPKFVVVTRDRLRLEMAYDTPPGGDPAEPYVWTWRAFVDDLLAGSGVSEFTDHAASLTDDEELARFLGELITITVLDVQLRALHALALRYRVPFIPDQFVPTFDLPHGYLAGWVGEIYVGVAPDGAISS